MDGMLDSEIGTFRLEVQQKTGDTVKYRVFDGNGELVASMVCQEGKERFWIQEISFFEPLDTAEAYENILFAYMGMKEIEWEECCYFKLEGLSQNEIDALLEIGAEYAIKGDGANGKVILKLQ